MATAARLLSRGSVRVHWMSLDEIEKARVLNGGFKTPVFYGDEDPLVPILGFRKVAWRVLGEIVLPAFLKRRWYVCPKSARSPTDAAA